MKKKVFVFTLSALLVLGSIQVYAATVLDTNIFDLMRSGFDSIRAYYRTEVAGESNSLQSDYTNDVLSYVNEKTDTVMNDIENHKNNELKRANQELQSYVDGVKNQVDSIANDEETKSKDEITKNVNSNIESIKAAIDKELQKQISTKLNK